MSFDKDYPNRKDIRKKYRKSKRFDRSCRNHGGCEYCLNNRLHKFIKNIPLPEDYEYNMEDKKGNEE